MIRLANDGTCDSFNPFIPKGNLGIGPNYFESLLESSADEPFTMYGLIAESLTVPEDRSWVIFTLRPQARWHDGTPITVNDVIWSFHIPPNSYENAVSGCFHAGGRRPCLHGRFSGAEFPPRTDTLPRSGFAG